MGLMARAAPISVPLAYVYVRMSTKEQAKGDSLRRQRSRQQAAERPAKPRENVNPRGASLGGCSKWNRLAPILTAKGERDVS